MAHIIWGSHEQYRTPLRPILLLGLATGAFFFLLLVWPTTRHYHTTGNTLYRVNRFTGCYQMATDSGWSRPWQRTC